MVELINNEEWKLRSLQIDFQEWGEHKGKYIGKVTFANGQKDAFTFSLDEAQSHDYLALIQQAVVKSANRLGDKIVNSMPKALSNQPTSLIEDVPVQ